MKLTLKLLTALALFPLAALTAADASKPVKVFILAGQSNMEGKAPTTCYDIHATMLHLLGLDRTQLTFRHNGIDRRLTDVHGEIIKEILL